MQAELKLHESDYIEVQTEFCGLFRKPHTTQLTQNEAMELEHLIEDIENRLLQTETR